MRRWYLGAIFAVGLALGGTVVWLVTRSDDSRTPSASSSSSPSSTPGVSVNAQQLLDRLQAATLATFHVRYTTGSSSTSHAILEIWHTADRVRRDVLAVSPTQGTVHTAEILLKKKLIRCASFDGKPFQCFSAPIAEGKSLSDPLQGANKGGVVDKKVTVTTTTIAGQAATCYSVAANPPGTPSQFCLASDDVPLRIDGGDGKPVEATNFDTKVPNSVFTPPATVAGS